MNWVLLLVAGILAGYAIAGYAKGFLKIVYSLVSWIVILVFAIVATPYIEDYIRTETNVYENVVVYCEEAIREQTQKEAEGGTNIGEVLSENELLAALAERLPEEALEELKMHATELTDDLVENYGIYNKTAGALADLFLQGVSTIVAIIMGAIASALLSMLLGFIGNLPLIGFANRILGVVAGAANGLLIVWIAFYLVAVLCATELGAEIITHIYTNEFLTALYEKNPILAIMM